MNVEDSLERKKKLLTISLPIGNILKNLSVLNKAFVGGDHGIIKPRCKFKTNMGRVTTWCATYKFNEPT